MNKFLIVSLVLLSLIVTFPRADANLLANPGFETGDYTGWSQWNPERSTIYNWGHNGSGHSVAGWWATSGWQDVSIANPDVPLTVGGWIYDNVAGGETMRDGVYAQLRAEFKQADDSVVGIAWGDPITGDDLVDNAWNGDTAEIVPSDFGPGITKATLVWEVNNTGTGSGIAIFDDFVAEPIPEPASILLLGTGIIGLFAFRKRSR